MEFFATGSVDFPVRRCALQQSEGYGRAIIELGAQAETFVACDAEKPIAKIQIVTRRLGPLNIAWVPRGPVWACELGATARARVISGLPSVLKTNAAWIIAPDTATDIEHLRHTRLVSPQSVAEIDLTTGPEDRLALQHGKWRNRLRQAQRSDLRVTHRRFQPERDNDVLMLELVQRKQRHYKALPPDFARAWSKMNPNDSRLFTIWNRNTVLAHMLVLLHRPVATYYIGWTNAEGRRYSAHNLGLWEATEWLAGKGFRRFDLGNVDTQHAPGLARFKIGSGARVRSLGATSLHLPRFSLRRYLSREAA